MQTSQDAAAAPPRSEQAGLPQRVLDALFCLVAVLSPDGTLLDANASARRTEDLPLEQIRGTKFWDLKAWSYDAAVREQVQEACNRAAQGRWSRYNVVNRLPDGQLLTLDFQISPLYDDAGLVHQLVASAVDVSAHRRAEQQLAEGKQRLELALQVGNTATWEWDLATNKAVVSDSYHRLLGAPADEPPTFESWVDILHPQDRDRCLKYVQDLLQSPDRNDWQLECRVVTPHLGVRWHSELGRVLRDDQGKPQRVIGVTTDITDQRRHEDALRTQRELLEGIIDNIPILLTIWDSSLRRFRFNRYMRDVLGWTDADAEDGQFMSKAVPDPEQRQQVIEFMQSLEPGFRDIKTTTKDGRTLDIAWANIALSDGSFIGIGVDLRERIKAEQALRESEERFRTMADGLPALVYVHDVQGGQKFVNRTYCEFFGIHHDQATGEGWQSLVHPEDREGYLNGFLQALRESRPFVGKVRVRRADGQWRWIESHAQPRLSPQRDLIGYVGLSFDVTESHEAQQRLQQREHELSMIAANTPDVLVRLDRHMRILFMNEAVRRATGLPPEHFIGKTPREAQLPDYLCDLADDKVMSVFCDGKPQDARFTFPSPDGLRHFKSRALAECTPEGKIEFVLIVIRDVTEEQEHETALRQARDELEQRVQERTAELRQRAEQLSRLTSELTLAEQRERRRLAQVLHDHLQQLLVGAKFGLDVLRQRAGPQHSDAIARVNKLIAESIDASRSLTMELSPPILHEAGLAPALEWLARWMKAKHNLQVDLHLDQDIHIDQEDVRVLVFQSVRELLFNVVKHAQVNRTRVRMDAPGGQYLRLVVSDKGKGFDPQTLDHPAHGGFGLFTMRERLALLGGRLQVQSQPGAGAQFTIIAPLGSVRDAVQAEVTAAAALPPAMLKPAQHEGGGHIRLLLVDDHVVVRQGLASLLAQEQDLRIVGEASDGIEALEQARKLHPDVVLMDFSMPRMNGVESTRCFRQQLPHIRVIGLSMYEEPDRAKAMKDAGAVAYLSKSGRSDILVKTIRAAADRAAAKPAMTTGQAGS